jgi:putative ABC transport system ATP-binding protein
MGGWYVTAVPLPVVRLLRTRPNRKRKVSSLSFLFGQLVGVGWRAPATDKGVQTRPCGTDVWPDGYGVLTLQETHGRRSDAEAVASRHAQGKTKRSVDRYAYRMGSESALVLSGVYQGFARGRCWVQALSDVALDVEFGEVVAIIGGRLSGKTTLLRVVAGLTAPESGSVRLGRLELADMSERKRSRLRGEEVVWLNRVGMSPKLQGSKIVSWSLPTCMTRRERKRRVAELLERVDAAHCARQRWEDLSRWEQVIIGYAQAFAARPRIVVIDDLLDALGEPWTRRASDLLRSLIEDAGRSCGVLMSASDRDSALYADRVWSLEGGRLIPTAGHYNRQAEVHPLRRRARE